jgi:hypothetical protein
MKLEPFCASACDVIQPTIMEYLRKDDYIARQ